MRALAEAKTIRFIVGTFDTWQRVTAALDDLRCRGIVLSSFNCLALKRIFSGKIILAPSQDPVLIEELGFSGHAEPICCTPGPLARCICTAVKGGAATLKEALGFWLIPRHAADLQAAVEKSKILLWLEIADPDEERISCLCFLACSSGPVGVHDLMTTPAQELPSNNGPQTAPELGSVRDSLFPESSPASKHAQRISDQAIPRSVDERPDFYAMSGLKQSVLDQLLRLRSSFENSNLSSAVTSEMLRMLYRTFEDVFCTMLAERKRQNNEVEDLAQAVGKLTIDLYAEGISDPALLKRTALIRLARSKRFMKPSV
jgi:hypothetical protein